MSSFWNKLRVWSYRRGLSKCPHCRNHGLLTVPCPTCGKKVDRVEDIGIIEELGDPPLRETDANGNIWDTTITREQARELIHPAPLPPAPIVSLPRELIDCLDMPMSGIVPQHIDIIPSGVFDTRQPGDSIGLISVDTTTPQQLIIQGSSPKSEEILRIDLNTGNVTINPGIEIDQAASEFWNAISRTHRTTMSRLNQVVTNKELTEKIHMREIEKLKQEIDYLKMKSTEIPDEYDSRFTKITEDL